MKIKIQSLVKDFLAKINWRLLIFLLLFLDVKLVVKLAALLVFCLLEWKMFSKEKIKKQQPLFFYFLMIGIAVLNMLISLSFFSVPYLLVIVVGSGFWLMCIIAFLLNYRYVEKTSVEILHNTLTLFFIMNAMVTGLQLLFIIVDSGAVNPYTYQGMHQKYFINTGDRLLGITFDTSTTNAFLNAFGMIYFLSKKKIGMVLFCIIILLLTASNLTNLLLIALLAGLFLFQSSRNEKSIILICFLLMTIFFARISPQNNQYITAAYNRFFNKRTTAQPSKIDHTPITQKPDSLLNPEEKKQKIAQLYIDSVTTVMAKKKERNHTATWTNITHSLPKANIHSEPYQRRRDTTNFQKKLLLFSKKNEISLDTNVRVLKKTPGKITAFWQTFDFFKNHPGKMILGNGMGNFSSKLAFRATTLEVAGGYPKKSPYMNAVFKNNHLKLYLSYFSKDIELHSLINSPDSVYNQLAGEYGLAGLLSFFIFYIGYFFKNRQRYSYTIPMLLFLLATFISGYWFEQLSIVVLFELIMFVNMKESKEKRGFTYHE